MKRILTYVLSLAVIVVIAVAGAFVLKKYLNRGKGEAVVWLTITLSNRSIPTETVIKDEGQVLRSKAVLGKVVDELKLDALWLMSREKAYEHARSRLGMTKGKKDNEVMIYYKDNNSEVAKRILQSLMRQYSRHQKERNKRAEEIMGL